MRLTMLTALAAAALLAGGCCPHKELAQVEITDSVRIHRLQAWRDSVWMTFTAELDSPEIRMEWPDSPRMVISVRARKISTRNNRSHTAAGMAAVDSAARKADRAEVRRETRCPGPRLSGWWVVATGVLTLILLGQSYAGTRARR